MECLWIIEPDANYDIPDNRHDKGYKHQTSSINKKSIYTIIKKFC